MSSSVEPFFGYGQQYGVDTYGTEVLYAPLHIANQIPAPGTTDVQIDQVAEFDILQGDLPILLDTVEVRINGAVAYDGATDTFSSPYNGVGSARTTVVGPPAGHHIAIQKVDGWLGGGAVSIEVTAQDSGATTLHQTWYFYAQDIGPLVTPLSPVQSEIGVDTSSVISMQIQDNNGVDPSSLRVFVKEGVAAWALAYDGSDPPQFKPGWDGPASAILGSSTDKTLVLDKTGRLPPLSVISVWVFVTDTGGTEGRL